MEVNSLPRTILEEESYHGSIFLSCSQPEAAEVSVSMGPVPKNFLNHDFTSGIHESPLHLAHMEMSGKNHPQNHGLVYGQVKAEGKTFGLGESSDSVYMEWRNRATHQRFSDILNLNELLVPEKVVSRGRLSRLIAFHVSTIDSLQVGTAKRNEMKVAGDLDEH